jgi:DNA-binding IclR family transcriptional regulator
VAVARERPGATAGELAAATGIARATVSSTLARLVSSGALERTQLPGGGVGFRVPAAPAPDLT